MRLEIKYSKGYINKLLNLRMIMEMLTASSVKILRITLRFS